MGSMHDLPLHHLDDSGMCVPERERPEGEHPVHVFIPVDVVETGALATTDVGRIRSVVCRSARSRTDSLDKHLDRALVELA